MRMFRLRSWRAVACSPCDAGGVPGLLSAGMATYCRWPLGGSRPVVDVAGRDRLISSCERKAWETLAGENNAVVRDVRFNEVCQGEVDGQHHVRRPGRRLGRGPPHLVYVAVRQQRHVEAGRLSALPSSHRQGKTLPISSSFGCTFTMVCGELASTVTPGKTGPQPSTHRPWASESNPPHPVSPWSGSQPSAGSCPDAPAASRQIRVLCTPCGSLSRCT